MWNKRRASTSKMSIRRAILLIGLISACALERGEELVDTRAGEIVPECPIPIAAWVGECPSCGDGVCSSGEYCPQDCGYCGDGVCGSGESGWCPEDCYVPPPPYLQWSSWLNRDNPSGAGDWETRADFASWQVGCSLPAFVNATTLGGVDWRSTGEVLTVSPDVGLVCRNDYQSDGACLDYRVQFGCATLDWTALPQSWHEDVDRISGAIQHFVPVSVPVPRARFLGAMVLDSGGSFSTLRLAPNDAHYWAYGSWSRSGNVITASFYDPRVGNVTERYEVAELKADTFRFRRI